VKRGLGKTNIDNAFLRVHSQNIKITERLMKIQDFNNQRDQLVIGELYRVLGLDQSKQIIPIVEEAFRKATLALGEEFLPIVYGKEGAQAIVQGTIRPKRTWQPKP
jgi:hypothetical protein